MKIVHLSTFDTGGAATAALRLHEGLLAAGMSSSFLSLYGSLGTYDPSRTRYQKHMLPLYRRVLGRFGVPVSQQDRNERMIRRLSGSHEAFTFPLTDHRVERHPLIRDADVVHLHWVANFINYPTFFGTVSKPIVWTLHDMNPLLGGFHYLGDKQRNPKFDQLEQTLRRVKESVYRNTENLTFVTPSKWLWRHAEKCEALSKFNRVHIPYGLDLNVFRPYSRELANDVFHLDPSKKVLLFVSERVDNYRKGFDILLKSLEQLQDRDDFQLVSIGFDSSSRDSRVHSLGSITDNRLLAMAFSAADAFILPSREDNLPNVMLEALACGTPVISFTNGGMSDVIKTGRTGILVPEISPEALQVGIRRFLSGEFVFDRTTIRSFAVSNFDSSLQSKQYQKLYEQLLG